MAKIYIISTKDIFLSFLPSIIIFLTLFFLIKVNTITITKIKIEADIKIIILFCS